MKEENFEDSDWEHETESRKLQLFTDRHKFTRLFAEYLNDDPPRSTILYWHGDGGNGKSLLLKFLRENCCKFLSPEVWSELKAKPDAEFVQEIQRVKNRNQGVKLIPAVLHDFEPLPGEDKRYQHPFDGLLLLRRNLAKKAEELGYQLKFPFYDYACVLYLYKQGKSVQEIRKLFPLSEIAGLIAPLVDVITQNPVGTFGKAVLDIFAKDLGEKFNFHLQKLGLNESEIEKIRNLDPERELIENLPRWFAQDLNAAIAQNDKLPRLVLFFDTHEAFWGEPRNMSKTSFQRDEWLRCLIKGLKRELGIVVVVTGREKPQWFEANKFKIPLEDLQTDEIECLSKADAGVYLKKAGVLDAGLVEVLINNASVAADKAHPFYLGLCADGVAAAARRGIQQIAADLPNILIDKSADLMNRLLRYADEDIQDAVHALSACRAFNRNIYLKLGDDLHFNPSAASFRCITSFSFVSHEVQEYENLYRISGLIRRLNYQENNEITSEAHRILEEYYQQQGDVVEAIYHAICLDIDKGMDDFFRVYDSANEQGDFRLCQRLVEIENELFML